MNQVYYRVSSSSSAEEWNGVLFTTKNIRSQKTAENICALLKKDKHTKKENMLLVNNFGAKVVELITGSNRGISKVEKLFYVTKYRVIVTTKKGILATRPLRLYYEAQQIVSSIVNQDIFFIATVDNYFSNHIKEVQAYERIEIEEVAVIDVKEADSDN